jgi:5'-3' exonuclease
MAQADVNQCQGRVHQRGPRLLQHAAEGLGRQAAGRHRLAFDLGRTFRDDLPEPYKGSATTDERVPQIDRITQFVQAFDIPAVSAAGYEDDDVLGTLASRTAAYAALRRAGGSVAAGTIRRS